MKKERTRLSRNNLLFLAGGILIGFSLSLIPNLLQTATAPTVTGPQSTVAKFDLPSFAPFRGSNSAQINLVEFGDYQCPFCARFFLLTEPQVLQNYANGGKLKFYFLDLTVIGADSLTLAQGAWCANEQGEYYQYHDYVFSHQGTENSGWGNASKVK